MEDNLLQAPIHVSEADFEKVVLQSTLPVIIDFWAPWCGPCKMIAPMLEKLAKEMAGQLLIAKVNTDENQDLAFRYNIQGIPTLLFISNGKVVHSQVGVLPEGRLRDAVRQFIAVVDQAKSSD